MRSLLITKHEQPDIFSLSSPQRNSNVIRRVYAITERREEVDHKTGSQFVIIVQPE
jgi:hypothetical protein